MNARRARALGALACVATFGAGNALAAEFGTPGGPEPSNLGAVWERLRQDSHDLELLISFGTSKGGSAGHLALAVREPGETDDWVYSANFYADRAPEHEQGRYTAELVTRVPKTEYLYGTRSSLGPTAEFGLDFGEAYKRSVVGVRVYGVPRAERDALTAYFARINADYLARARNTRYHYDEVHYDYLRFNCAKTIGVAFKYGAGYRDLVVKEARLLPGLTTAVKAAQANVPTEMAMKLMREWHSRGRSMDVVFYKKYPRSAWVDPHAQAKVAFKDLPNRFPSVISLDFTSDQGEYEDYDNLYAMYLLYNLGKYSLALDGDSHLVEISRSKTPMGYGRAAQLAKAAAQSDSRGFLRRLPFVPKGQRVGDPPGKTYLQENSGAEPVNRIP